MAKVNPAFQYDVFRFIHKPIREADKKVNRFLERFVGGPQIQFEALYDKINRLTQLYDPALTPVPQYLKDTVGLTKELDNILRDVSEQDLRKLIGLAVPLWKQMGLEVGYRTIIRLFTGKNSRTFNWFDYRYIIGEQSLAQEELGEDSWIISVPGVTASPEIAGNVVGLWPFEQNFKDRSIRRNDAVVHGNAYFFATGPVTGSDFYLHLPGTGAVRAPHTAAYDLSGSFTLELFFRTDVAQNAVLFRKALGSKLIEVRLRTDTQQLSYTLSDGVTTVTETLIADLDDGAWHHVALVVNRATGTQKARLYRDGTQSTAGASTAALGDPGSAGDLFIGAASVGAERFTGDLDNARLSLSAQYNVALGILPVPAAGFIEYEEEQLDEFFTDIRVVDNGDLNRALVKRVLNLMRPPSERLRIIYIRFFEAFDFGKGALASVVPGASVDTALRELILPPGAVEVADVVGAEDFEDVVVQVRVKVAAPGGVFGVRFLVLDTDNYYLLTMDTTVDGTGTFRLWRVVAGVATQIGTDAVEEIYNDVYYIITVLTDRNDVLGETQIKTLVDGNVLHKVVDSTYEKGTWGVQAGAGTTARLSHIEMFEMPLDTETIRPNDVI